MTEASGRRHALGRSGECAGPLLGRDREMEESRRWLTRAATAAGVLLIEGEAGIGKTRLLEEVIAAASDAGFEVLAGACHELAQDHPFGAIQQALGSQQPGVRHRRGGETLDDVLDRIQEVDRAGPVLLAVDDIQWADAPSLAVLDHLARSSGGNPVAIACSLRHGSRRPEPPRFRLTVIGRGALHLQLGPLPDDAVAALVARAVGGRPSDRLLAHVRGASGNPHYVYVLVRALRHEGAPRAEGAGADVVDPVTEDASARFRQVVDDQVGLLPPDTVETVRLASVLGPTFTLSDLGDAFGVPASVLMVRLSPAIAEGIVVESGEQLAFRHGLFRDAVYGGIPLSARTAFHLQAGRALAAAGAPAVQVAGQLGLGGPRGRQIAVDLLARAAAQTADVAPGVSVDLLALAVEFAGPAHPERARLRANHARALVLSGRSTAAADAALELLPAIRGGPVERGVRRTLGLAYLAAGRGVDAAVQLEILAARPEWSDAERVVCMSDAAVARSLSGELLRGRELADAAAALAESLGDEGAICAASSALALVGYLEGRLDQAVTAARRAVAFVVPPRGYDATMQFPQHWLCLCLADAERYEEAAAAVDRSRLASDALGRAWHAVLNHVAGGRIQWLAGRWDAAAAEMEKAIEVARERGCLWAIPQQQCYLAHMALHRDETLAAEAAMEAADRTFRAVGLWFGVETLAWTRALWHEGRGELKPAAELGWTAWSLVVDAGYLVQAPSLGVDVVRLVLATGDRDRAGAACAVLDEAAKRLGMASTRGIAMHCRSLLEGGTDLLLQAVAALEEGRRPVPLALAYEDASAALARRGWTADAASMLDNAVATYRRIGARRDFDRALARLRKLGISRPRPRLARRPALGWDALTGTEQLVAELAASGLTNPEVGRRLGISRRTVETHLSHIFGKLDISSRVVLAASHARRPASAASQAADPLSTSFR